MNGVDTRAGPAVGRIGVEQVAVLGLGRRRELIGVVVLVVGIMTLALIQFYRQLPGIQASMAQMQGLAPEEALRSAHAFAGSMFAASLGAFAALAVLIGAGWGTRVWVNEGPGRRDYHWSMPVDRRIHEVLRVGAGVLWLVVLITGILIMGALLAAITGAGTLMPWAVLTPATWLAALAGPVAAYLVVSAVALRSGHPGFWVLGTGFGYLLLRGVTSEFGPEGVYTALVSVWDGRLGLKRLFEGGMMLSARAFETLEDRGVDIPGQTGPALQLPEAWLTGVLFWLGLGVLAVAGAALIQRAR